MRYVFSVSHNLLSETSNGMRHRGCGLEDMKHGGVEINFLVSMDVYEIS